LVLVKKARKLVRWCHEVEESWTNYHLTRSSNAVLASYDDEGLARFLFGLEVSWTCQEG
jgi:predicted transcriptional regulator